jgi:hypothetical protein
MQSALAVGSSMSERLKPVHHPENFGMPEQAAENLSTRAEARARGAKAPTIF